MRMILCINAQRPDESRRCYIIGLISTGINSLHNIKNIFDQLEIFVELIYSHFFLICELRISYQQNMRVHIYCMHTTIFVKKNTHEVSISCINQVDCNIDQCKH